MDIFGCLADRRVRSNLSAARQEEIGRDWKDPKCRMGLQALRQAEAIGMCVFWIGHMCAKRHLGAKRCALRMKGRSWRSARQESLEHKRIEGEGREPLLKQSLKSCPPLVHGENRASKNRFGQAAREDVMGEKQPGIQCGYGWGRNSQVIEKNGRSERIRTSDPLVPNEVRYQAALHSVLLFYP